MSFMFKNKPMQGCISSFKGGEMKVKNQWWGRCQGRGFKRYLPGHCFDSVGTEESLKGLGNRKAVANIQFAHSQYRPWFTLGPLFPFSTPHPFLQLGKLLYSARCLRGLRLVSYCPLHCLLHQITWFHFPGQPVFPLRNYLTSRFFLEPWLDYVSPGKGHLYIISPCVA